MQTRRRAFTLLEVLVVISIMVVLIGIVTIAVRHVTRTSKQNATKVTLAALKGMLSEAESTSAVSKLSGLSFGAIADNASAKFEVVAPDQFLDSDNAVRFGQESVRTQRALRALLSLPNNRRAYEQLPSESKMRLVYQAGVNYMPGDQVEHPAGSGKFYVCVTDRPSAPPSGWAVDNTPHTSLLTDGWSNPIWFVRGSDPRAMATPPEAPYSANNIDGAYGLTTVTLGTQVNQVIVNPQSVPWDKNKVSNLKLYRPFWASAGADGNFKKGDDNMYSFEP